MAVSRPSSPLKNKSNVNPVVNRPTEATAEDFQEVGALLDEYADALDLLLGSNYRADFLGYFGSKALLEATFPAPPENSFGIVVDQSNNPVEIWSYTAGAYVLVQGSDNIKFYNSRTNFPASGEVNVIYIAKDSRQIYGWWNSRYYKFSTSAEVTYDQYTYKNITDLASHTITEDFEVVLDGQGVFFFLVKNTMLIDLNNCRLQFIDVDKVADFTTPTVTESNFIAYILPFSSMPGMFFGDTYNFTFWRKIVPTDLSQLNNDVGFITGINNITEIPNRSYNDLQDLPLPSSLISSYNPIKFIESTTFPTYTMTDEFELVRENFNAVYFLVRDDVSIDFANCRVKLLENNKATDLTSPDIEQSNYKAYLVNLELYSSILVDGDTYNFTFWRKSLQAIIEQTRSQSITSVPSSKLLDDQLTLKADIAVEQATITNITFAKQQTYGTPAAPLTGAFTVDNTGAKFGMIQKIYHNAASEPTILSGATFFKAGTGEYVPSVLNVIFIEWIAVDRYEYWIVQFS